MLFEDLVLCTGIVIEDDRFFMLVKSMKSKKISCELKFRPQKGNKKQKDYRKNIVSSMFSKCGSPLITL